MTADLPLKKIFYKFLKNADLHNKGKTSQKNYIKAKKYVLCLHYFYLKDITVYVSVVTLHCVPIACE